MNTSILLIPKDNCMGECLSTCENENYWVTLVTYLERYNSYPSGVNDLSVTSRNRCNHSPSWKEGVHEVRGSCIEN